MRALATLLHLHALARRQARLLARDEDVWLLLVSIIVVGLLWAGII